MFYFDINFQSQSLGLRLWNAVSCHTDYHHRDYNIYTHQAFWQMTSALFEGQNDTKPEFGLMFYVQNPGFLLFFNFILFSLLLSLIFNATLDWNFGHLKCYRKAGEGHPSKFITLFFKQLFTPLSQPCHKSHTTFKASFINYIMQNFYLIY